MLGQLRNEIGKRGVTSSSDAAADEELVPPPRMEMNWVLKVSPSVTSEGFCTRVSLHTSSEDAEDIVQETFRKAFVHLQKFEGKSSFSTWLTRIASTKP